MASAPRPNLPHASSSQASRPPITLHQTTHISDQASLAGTHPIKIGANTVIHPRCRFISTHGPIEIGANCIVSERSILAPGDERGLYVEDNVIIEPAAQVESLRIGHGSDVGAASKLGKGSIIGANCRLSPMTRVPSKAIIEDNMVYYGSNEARLDTLDVTSARKKQLESHIKVLKTLVSMLMSNANEFKLESMKYFMQVRPFLTYYQHKPAKETHHICNMTDQSHIPIDHLHYLKLSLEEAKKCTPVLTAFCVGCILLSPKSGTILSQGYSRELPGNTHAEQCALDKLVSSPYKPVYHDKEGHLTTSSHAGSAATREDADVKEDSIKKYDTLLALLPDGCIMYTTVEPCSERLSGQTPCADRILRVGKTKISEVCIGAQEPDTFVRCIGVEKLEAAGIKVTRIKGLEKECLEVAERGHEKK